jgi:hypothetical protein
MNEGNREAGRGRFYAFRFWEWGDNDRRLVPENFVFPSIAVKDMWDLWYFGNVVTGFRPFRCLVGHEDDLREHKHKVNFSRAKGVIEELESLGREHGSIETVDNILEMEDDFQARDIFFYGVYEDLVFNLYKKRPARPYTKKCNTVYKRMRAWYNGTTQEEEEINDEDEE